MISVRKAHIDEVGSSPSEPIDDDTDLSPEIKSIIIQPVINVFGQQRNFFVSLFGAMAETAITAPVMPAIMQKIVTALNYVVDDQNAASGYIIGPTCGFGASDGQRFSSVFPQDKTGDIADISSSSAGSATWTVARTNLPDNSGSAEEPNSNEARNAMIYGKVDAAANSAIETSMPVGGEGYYHFGYLFQRIWEYQIYIDGGGDKYDYLADLTAPSLISDIARIWAYVKDFVEGTLADYAETTIDLFSDENDALLDAAKV
jgi:hypothetical protein